jgi:hypothetical protein
MFSYHDLKKEAHTMKVLKALLPVFLLLLLTACFGNQTTPTPNPEPTEKEKEIVLVFADNELMDQYKETRKIKYTKEEDLPKLALEEWIKGPVNTNLQSIVPENVTIQSIKKENDNAIVSFSPEIKNANLGSTGELYLVQQVATILSQFGYKNTIIQIDETEVETLLGHVDTTHPIEPLDINQLKEK